LLSLKSAIMKKADTAKTEATTLAPQTGPPAPAGTPSALQPPAEPTAPLASLQAEIEALKAEAAKATEYHDKLLRTAADFENYKKRVARERTEAAKYAHEALLLKLIPILDNFDMALAAASSSTEANAQALRDGVAMIHQQFKSALAEAGLEEINAVHQKFDPHLHEAVSQHEVPDVPEGHVAQQLRKGYKLRDRLLRPASVVVAKAPPDVPDGPEPEAEDQMAD
jgi:molecular chaperone GrpE